MDGRSARVRVVRRDGGSFTVPMLWRWWFLYCCGGEAVVAGRWSQICDQVLVVDLDRDRFVTIKFNKL